MKKQTEMVNPVRDKLAISVPQAAKLLGISRDTAYTLVRREDFLAFQIGNRILVSTAGLAAWVDRQAERKAG